MMASNQYVHSKQLFACSISTQSVINQQHIILGTLGVGSQQILCKTIIQDRKVLQSSEDGYKINKFELAHCFSKKLQFVPTSDDNRFISGGEKLQIFKFDGQKISHIVDLFPKSKQFNGPTTSFDIHRNKQTQLVSCSIDSSIRIWDLEKKQITSQLLPEENFDANFHTLDVNLSQHPEVFAYLDSCHQIGIFDCRINKGIRKINGKLSYSQIHWHKFNGERLAAMDCETNTIDFYDMRNNNNKYQRVRTDGELSSGAWFYSRNAFVTAGLDQKIISHEGDSMEPQYELTKQFPIDNICCNQELFGVISDNIFEVFSFDL